MFGVNLKKEKAEWHNWKGFAWVDCQACGGGWRHWSRRGGVGGVGGGGGRGGGGVFVGGVAAEGKQETASSELTLVPN